MCRNQKYVVGDKEYMRMKFYVKGTKRKANVQLDLVKVLPHPSCTLLIPPYFLIPFPLEHVQNNNGKYDCRFLFVELEGPPHSTIVITDNR